MDARRGKNAAAHTLNKGSQTALITRLSVSLCLDFPDAGRVAPISRTVKHDLRILLDDASLFQGYFLMTNQRFELPFAFLRIISKTRSLCIPSPRK